MLEVERKRTNLGMSAFNPIDAARRCQAFRRRILHLSQSVSALHIGAAFSAMEIVDALYFGIMNEQPADTFIMSKGHGYLAQLVALEELGVLSAGSLDLYCTAEGSLGVHPERGTPGIIASTGSLGHGLGIALGIALTARAGMSKRFQHRGRVFVLISDGELHEGSTWESILLAPSLRANNLICVVDNNNLQSLGFMSTTHPSLYPIETKFEAFGWESVVVDGHSEIEIREVVSDRDPRRPLAIVAQTTKGKGVSFMENRPIWHYRSPNPSELAAALAELDSL